jgi:hypothetical protein
MHFVGLALVTIALAAAAVPAAANVRVHVLGRATIRCSKIPIPVS